MTDMWITLRTPNRRPLTVLVDAPLVVGRECDGLILPDQRVSRRHTSFEPAGDKLVVTDLGSSNGTVVNGDEISGPATIAEGDVVTIGNTTITVRAQDAGAASVPTELTGPPTPTTKTSIELVADSVQEDRIGAEVVGAEDEPGTLTVVFSDIEGSTELALALGDAEWFDVLGRHHRLVTAHVDAHRGRIVKNQGDGYMLCFRSGRQAILTAIGIQRDLDRLGSQPAGDGRDQRLQVRIGAHTGEVMMQDDGDLFGKHVIVAARIAGLAAGGTILVSNLVKQIVEPRGDIPFGPPMEADLKGIAGRTIVHEVDWAAYRST